MPLSVASVRPQPRIPRAADVSRPERLKKSYDVVIIGGGGHGLAAAYYLARDHGITNVAVLEKGYIGGGNTGRNTAIVRSNYLTPEGVEVLRRERAAVSGAVRGPRPQPVLFRARPLHAGPHRQHAAHDALAGRGQQAPGRRQRRRSRREEIDGSARTSI